MSLKARSIGALGATLVAMGAMAVASATASAVAPLTCAEAKSEAKICEDLVEFEASGSITDRKLNQAIPLKEGRYNGYLELQNLFPVSGLVHGLVTSQPLEVEVKLFGSPAKVGVTFEQVGVVTGSLTQIEPKGSPNCELNPVEEVCVTLSVPTEANIGFTSVTVFGLKFPMKCKTSKPIVFPLTENLRLVEELLNFEVGSHFTGTTTFPSVTCGAELFKFLNESFLTSDFSGPENSYSLFIRK
jgi:hypothetical protein